MISQMYIFSFFNANISNWRIAFYNQNYNALQKNLIIIMVFKQLIMNIWEFSRDKYKIGRALDKVDEMFAKRKNDIRQ